RVCLHAVVVHRRHENETLVIGVVGPQHVAGRRPLTGELHGVGHEPLGPLRQGWGRPSFLHDGLRGGGLVGRRAFWLSLPPRQEKNGNKPQRNQPPVVVLFFFLRRHERIRARVCAPPSAGSVSAGTAVAGRTPPVRCCPPRTGGVDVAPRSRAPRSGRRSGPTHPWPRWN